MLKSDTEGREFRSMGYATALRSVGILLKMHGFQTFDVRCETREYWLKCAFEIPPCSTPIKLRYTIDELKALERKNVANRSGLPGRVDFHGLPEVLRGLGGYIEKKKGNLIKITNNDATIASGAVKVEYNSSGGYLQEEMLSLASIYEICVRMYKERNQTTTTTNKFANSYRR